jgi:hypothetical protein
MKKNHGSKWCDIVTSHLPSRSKSSVRNRWNYLSRKRKRQNDLEHETVTCLGTAADEDILKNLVNNAVHMATPIPQSSAFGDSSSTSWLHTTQIPANLTTGIWTHAEDVILLKAYEILGSKWREIATSHLPSRSESSVKNRWNKLSRKNDMERKKSFKCSTSSNTPSDELPRTITIDAFTEFVVLHRVLRGGMGPVVC